MAKRGFFACVFLQVSISRPIITCVCVRVCCVHVHVCVLCCTSAQVVPLLLFCSFELGTGCEGGSLNPRYNCRCECPISASWSESTTNCIFVCICARVPWDGGIVGLLKRQKMITFCEPRDCVVFDLQRNPFVIQQSQVLPRSC